MGQTLTHGVYLPAEGERNCYDGLASNWNILDGAVGTIAEHTTALAGKAPAVHTHTKSDITDLLNSNFIPSANNSYDLGSSSYQWNNVYASKIRQFDSFSGYADVYQVLDSSNNRIVSFRITKGATKNTLGINVHDQNNSAPKGLVIENDLSNNITITGGGTNNYLGTSTSKWKSLNGINPGALSLPDVSDGDPISTIGWSLTGARNTYTPTENGWFFIRVKGTASAKCSLNIHSGSYNDNYPTWVSYNDPTISLSTSLVVPAQKSVNLYVYIIAADIEQLIFFPCLGNV